eukprot:Selendium_serpulae@DN5965_c6_g1_i1.p1
MADCSTEDIFEVEGCGHRSCCFCARGHIVAEISNENIPVRCPLCVANDDDERMTFLSEEQTLLHLNEVQQRNYFKTSLKKGTVGLVQCTEPDCPGIAEMAGGVLGCPTRFRCPIATCGKERCVECKVEWHDDKSCEEFQAGLRGSAEAEVGIAEMKNAGVVKECPRCKAPGVLAEGCYHVTCERCKAEMCWVCGEDITGNYLPHFAHGMPCKLFPNYDHIP